MPIELIAMVHLEEIYRWQTMSKLQSPATWPGEPKDITNEMLSTLMFLKTYQVAGYTNTGSK